MIDGGVKPHRTMIRLDAADVILRSATTSARDALLRRFPRLTAVAPPVRRDRLTLRGWATPAVRPGSVD